MSDEIKEQVVDGNEATEAIEIQSSVDELKDLFGFTTDEQQGPENEDEQEQDSQKAAEEDEPEKVQVEESSPLEARLGEIESEFNLKDADTFVPDVDPDEQRIQTLEQGVAQYENYLRNTDFLAQFPKDGVFSHNGKTIYEMSDKELNDYMTDLQERGEVYAAGQVQTTYFKAVDAASQFLQIKQAYQQASQQLAEERETFEWKSIRKEFETKLPELTDKDYAAIANFIQQNQSDPAYVNALSTRKGKMEKGVEAMHKLGIFKRLKESIQKQEVKKPSAPDAHAASKKVKRTEVSDLSHQLDRFSKMSQKEFNKLSNEEIEAALEAGFS